MTPWKTAKPLLTTVGPIDEGVAFGLLVAFVFVFVIGVEYIRARRAKAEALSKEQYANAAVWGVMLTMAAGGYVVAPNVALRHDISILLTCGASFQMLAFGLLWVAPRRCTNVSLPRAPADFAVLMALALSMRVVVELHWSGYLPVDRTGDGVIQLFEAITVFMVFDGLRKMRVERGEIQRALFLACGSVFVGQFCFGDLDVDSVADKAFAISIYCEFLGWCCMARYVCGRGREAVNGMVFPLTFVQAICRSYFWYTAIPETRVREPIYWAQTKFNWVLFGMHVLMGLVAFVMSTFTVREIKPALPQDLLTPEPFIV
jgi:hypothetical protein